MANGCDVSSTNECRTTDGSLHGTMAFSCSGFLDSSCNVVPSWRVAQLHTEASNEVDDLQSASWTPVRTQEMEVGSRELVTWQECSGKDPDGRHALPRAADISTDLYLAQSHSDVYDLLACEHGAPDSPVIIETLCLSWSLFAIGCLERD